MRSKVAVVLWVLAACSGSPEAECLDYDQVFVYADNDGDGFGIDRVGWVCAAGPGQSVAAGDCDDAEGTAYPNAVELCDEVDNDCNGVVDDHLALYTWYEDLDGDTFGQKASQPSCAPQNADWIAASGDCDDDDALVNPLVREVCNGYDDDCDGQADDEDLGVDPTSQTRWYRDSDGDEFGDDLFIIDACVSPGAGFVEQPGDCDDVRPLVNPNIVEACNLRDDDCDALVDDDDPSVDPAGQNEYFTDADLDTYGDPTSLTLACRPIAGAVENDDDCDDNDATATVVRDWFDDDDLDGVGAGAPIANACHAPGAGTAPLGTDCDDDDPLKFPGNPEVCEDGFDQDCSGDDRQCATWLYTINEQNGTLERVDVQTGVFESIGFLGAGFYLGDLAYDPATSTMYMIDGTSGQNLYTVDITTAATTLIGSHGQTDMLALAWDPDSSTLYATRWYPYELNIMNTLNGSANMVGNPGIETTAMTYDTTRDELVAMVYPGTLSSVNPANGNLTFLANPGFVDFSGLAYDPTGDMFYAIDIQGSMYRYDPNNGYARTTLAMNLGQHDALVYVEDAP